MAELRALNIQPSLYEAVAHPLHQLWYTKHSGFGFQNPGKTTEFPISLALV